MERSLSIDEIIKSFLVKWKIQFIWGTVILLSLATSIWPIQFFTINDIYVLKQLYWRVSLPEHLFRILCFMTCIVMPCTVFLDSIRKNQKMQIFLSAVFAFLLIPVFFMDIPDPGNRLPLSRCMFLLSMTALIGVIIYETLRYPKPCPCVTESLPSFEKSAIQKWFESDAPICSQEEDYCQRDSFAHKIAQNIYDAKENNEVVILVGDKKAGKTSMLNLIEEFFTNKNRFIYCKIDTDDLKPVENQTVISLLLEKLHEKIKTLLDDIKENNDQNISKNEWKELISDLLQKSDVNSGSITEIESGLNQHNCRILLAFDEVDNKTLKAILLELHTFPHFRFLVACSSKTPFNTFPADLKLDVRYLRKTGNKKQNITFFQNLLDACYSREAEKDKIWHDLAEYIATPSQMKKTLRSLEAYFNKHQNLLDNDDLLFFSIYENVRHCDLPDMDGKYQLKYEQIKKKMQNAP